MIWASSTCSTAAHVTKWVSSHLVVRFQMMIHLLETSVFQHWWNLRSEGMEVHQQRNICSCCYDDLVSTSMRWNNNAALWWQQNRLRECAVRTITITRSRPRRRRLLSPLLWLTIDISSRAESLHQSCQRTGWYRRAVFAASNVNTVLALGCATQAPCTSAYALSAPIWIAFSPLFLFSLRRHNRQAKKEKCVLGEIQRFGCKRNLFCNSFMVLFSSIAAAELCGGTNRRPFFIAWQQLKRICIWSVTSIWFFLFFFKKFSSKQISFLWHTKKGSRKPVQTLFFLFSWYLLTTHQSFTDKTIQ